MLTPIFLISLTVSARVALGSPIASEKDDNVPELEWYKQYYVEVEKYSVLAGIVEDMKVWHTRVRSRVDYHDGVTKKIIYSPKASDSPFGEQYEIRHETTKDEPVCVETPFGFLDEVEPVDVLPDVDGFEKIGTYLFRGLQSCQFNRNFTVEHTDVRETLWASYNPTMKKWVPLRYIRVDYSELIGSMTNHNIWDFYNFKTKFSLSKTFDNLLKDCKEEFKTIKHHMNDEDVTKHLHFIDPDNEKHVDHVFTAFKNKYNKDYSRDKKEHALRRKIFQENIRIIAATNRQNLGYKLAVNQFSDRTKEEKKRMQGLKRREPGQIGTKAFPYTKEDIDDALDNLPQEYDARDEGLVSPVKNQLDCGSCWTFGTTAAAEGAVARSYGRLMRLSNQPLLDCAWDYGGTGCDGGTDVGAYKWMMDYGLPTEEEYGSYSNMENICNIDNMTMTYKIAGFTDVTPKSVGALKVALVNHGPLSVSVDANEKFQQYSSGIYYDPDCSESSLTHEVALVGYGEQNGEPYWILKNSWGLEWGLGGYMLISAKDNNCGVMTEPTYAFV